MKSSIFLYDSLYMATTPTTPTITLPSSTGFTINWVSVNTRIYNILSVTGSGTTIDTWATALQAGSASSSQTITVKNSSNLLMGVNYFVLVTSETIGEIFNPVSLLLPFPSWTNYVPNFTSVINEVIDAADETELRYIDPFTSDMAITLFKGTTSAGSGADHIPSHDHPSKQIVAYIGEVSPSSQVFTSTEHKVLLSPNDPIEHLIVDRTNLISVVMSFEDGRGNQIFTAPFTLDPILDCGDCPPCEDCEDCEDCPECKTCEKCKKPSKSYLWVFLLVIILIETIVIIMNMHKK